MADTVPSTNMSMPIPVVGQDPGPQYGYDLNSCLTIVDRHDHSAGNGVAITPDGLNINSDLSFGNSNQVQVKSTRFYPQSVALSDPADIGCLYEVGDDLYYNDGSGNQVRITQSGAVAGTPGSIANLTSPASATYVSGSQTFVWQSDVNTPANLDAASIILRNLSASSFGLTLSPPAAMGANYALVLPSLPASQKFMTLDASGNMGAPWAVDNSTLEISSNTLQVKNSGIVTAKIADGAVTKPKLAALGQQLSSSCSNFTTTSSSYVDVTNLSVSITSTGRPIFVGLIHDGSSNQSSIGGSSSSSGSIQVDMKIIRDSTDIVVTTFLVINTSGSNGTISIPVSSLSHVDVVGAGTYTYKIQIKRFLANNTVAIFYAKLLAYEM